VRLLLEAREALFASLKLVSGLRNHESRRTATSDDFSAGIIFEAEVYFEAKFIPVDHRQKYRRPLKTILNLWERLLVMGVNDGRQRSKNTTNLPKTLQDELGSANERASGAGQSLRRVTGRKDRRKAERVQKKVLKSRKTFGRPAAGSQRAKQARRNYNDEEDDDDDDNDEDEDEKSPPPHPLKKKAASKSTQLDLSAPKSILKRTAQPDKAIPSRNGIRSPSPPPRMTKAIRDRLAADDEEIAALEKALGVKKGGKLPQSFAEDGLDFLLEGLEGQGDTGIGEPKRKRGGEDDDWLKNKRRKAAGVEAESEEDEEDGDSEEEEDFDNSSAEDDGDEDLDDSDLEEDVDDAPDFEEFDSDSVSTPPPQVKPRVRENPYVAPSTSAVPVGKYIPPSMRGAPTDETESLSRLRRQIQGLLNRLSEANLLSIVGEVEKVFQNNPRGNVTRLLTDLILDSVCDRTSLMDTFMILHAGFVAALYKIMGTDFGASFVQRVVEEFDRHYAEEKGEAQVDSGKQTTNMISLLSELYNFQVVGSNLIFDYVRMFLGTISELNTELLLKVIRSRVYP
jgi:nucleolar MIF4G domain-containing protein 1